jgi:hypothetical protein
VERLLVTKAEAAELAGQLPTMPGLRRYLRISSAGLLRVDRAAIAVEAKLDGKFLLRCSDPQLSARTSRWATSSCCKWRGAGGT